MFRFLTIAVEVTYQALFSVFVAFHAYGNLFLLFGVLSKKGSSWRYILLGLGVTDLYLLYVILATAWGAG